MAPAMDLVKRMMEKQIMQRRIGEQAAQEPVIRRNSAGDDLTCARSFAKQGDGTVRGTQQLLLCIGYGTEQLDGSHVRTHDREGLVALPFPVPEPLDCAVIRRITGKMEPAEAFHGDNAAVLQHVDGCLDRSVAPHLIPLPPRQRMFCSITLLVGQCSFLVPPLPSGERERARVRGTTALHVRDSELNGRAALRTGIRLGMEAPVAGIIILGAAVRAHQKGRHSCVRAVIRDGARNGIPGAALGAVDEGIEMAPVGWIKKFPQTGVAGRHIGRKKGEGSASRGVHALPDREFSVSRLREGHDLELVDPRERRRFERKPLKKSVETTAFDVDHDAVVGIDDIPLQAELCRKGVNIGPEAHALDNASDYDLSPLNHVVQLSIPCPFAQETSNICSPRFRVSESFRTLFMSVFM